MAQVQVKWAGRRFGIEFADSEELSNYTVSQFKEKCQRLTGVDSQDMKLLAYGAVMKNDQAQLRAYGIRPGSQLLLIGTVKKNDAVFSTLENVSSKVKEKIMPEIEAYEARVRAFLADKTRDSEKKLTEFGLYLVEQLMQLMFELDAVSCAGPGLETARQERKKNVQQCQALLDRVDGIKALLRE